MLSFFCRQWGLALILIPSLAWTQNADQVRKQAPVTALLYDLAEGRLRPLQNAYFEDEIDFFLDYQGAQNSIASSLYYLREAGRALDRGDAAAARNFITQIEGHRDEVQYLEAVSSAVQGRYEQAMLQFRQLIDRRQSISRRLTSRALLGAARVAHEEGDYRQAVFYYSRLNQLDPLFFQSVFEKSWSLYLQGDMNGALGASLSFMTPYAANLLYPESYIVRAASYYQLCLFEQANQVVEDKKSVFLPIRGQIRELRARAPESWLFDENVLRSISPRVLGRLVQDTAFRRLQRAHQALVTESTQLQGDARAKSEEALRFVRARLRQESLRALRQMEAELDRALEQADSIQIEVLQLGVNVLTGAPIETRQDIQVMDLGDLDFSELVQFWPFKGEFWLDELGSYYFGLKSQCDRPDAFGKREASKILTKISRIAPQTWF
jgi:tetratricopeptide (TPR) repeat protein